MKILKLIGISILVLALLIISVGLFLPSKVHIERSIVVNNTPDVPYNLINDLTKFNDWSPWYKIDTNAAYTYSELKTGVGACILWKSNNTELGNGKLTITESKPNELIVTKLEVDGWDPSSASYFFTKENKTTKIIWTMDSDMGYNIIGRWFGLFMDDMIGEDYEKGLASIKKICEEKPIQEKIAGYDVNFLTIPSQNYIYTTDDNVNANEIGLKIGASLMKLDAFAKNNQIVVSGPPFTIWYSPTNFVVGIPFSGDKSSTDKNIKFGQLIGCDAYVVSYYGSYANTQPVYENMSTFILNKGKRPSGPPRELYLSDPFLEKDTAKWLTEIVFPVQ